MSFESRIEEIKNNIRELGRDLRWLRSRQKVIERLESEGIELAGYAGQMDFDNLPHDKVVKVVRALGGKWKKSMNSGKENRVDYATSIDGMSVRCWAGEPPPACKIVEVEEHIPERVIPASTRIVKKMICPGQDPVILAVATAANKQIERTQ